VCVCVKVCVCVCVCVCVGVCECAFAFLWVLNDMNMHIFPGNKRYIHTEICVYIHIQIHKMCIKHKHTHHTDILTATHTHESHKIHARTCTACVHL
jgi:hypothetical protein